jgi:hypothetical protein
LREKRVSKKTEPPLRLEWRTPEELADNELNWRRHPDGQVASLEAVLEEVGWAGAALFNERTKRLIDGHLRKKVPQKLRVDGKIPVLVGSWTEEQEKTILATLDPLAAMAEADDQKLGELLAGIQTDNAALDKMLKDLAEENQIDLTEPHFEPVGEDEQSRLDEKTPIQCPSCGHEFTP